MAPASDRPTAPVTLSDLELLRKFEPVLCYTKGEQFFPTDVDHYVKDSSLWEHHPDGRDEILVRHGELTLEKLVEPHPAEFGSVRFLRFIEPLNLAESALVLADRARLRRNSRRVFPRWHWAACARRHPSPPFGWIVLIVIPVAGQGIGCHRRSCGAGL